jgi:cation/acetate symporter
MTPRAQSATLKCVLLVLWASVSFGPVYFARSLQRVVLGWPLNYWMAAQGCLLLYIAIVSVYAWWRGRLDGALGLPAEPGPTDG